MLLSVLLCTHNPREDYLAATLAALRAQSLPGDDWELILVDNASFPPVKEELVRGRVVREETLGLTRARVRGMAEARGDLLVFCDDDNLLEADYLAEALKLFAARPGLGAAGGKALPRYLAPLPEWFRPFTDRLAVRDLGEVPLAGSWAGLDPAARSYPPFAPVGAGMVLRREVAAEYVRVIGKGPFIPDRVGRRLSSGGDGAMVLTALRAGWEVGYFPELKLTHVISGERLRLGYLARLNRASSESWVRLLAQHGLFPWRPISPGTVWLRQVRAFFSQGAWRGAARYFQWAGACGLFAGRAGIGRGYAGREMTRSFSSPLTPGRLLYLLYHYPLGEIQRSILEGGPREQWLDRRGREAMRSAAAKLPALDFGNMRALELHQLTGRDYAFQSLFCLWSFAHAAQHNLAPTFYDDGTLTALQAGQLRTAFPEGRVVTHEETVARLEMHLPARSFPVLRERFWRYPLIRKLINIHLGAAGWKLVLDADLLFFRRPDFLLDWLDHPQRPLHLLDVADAYGYSAPLLEKLAGGPLPGRVNVGLCGLRSESIDWEKLEWWCGALLREEGSHYLLEQALVALLLAGNECAIAAGGDYITLPEREEVISPRAVMHHYVGSSKRWYFREGWRHFGCRE